jgi:hypothetical protein
LPVTPETEKALQTAGGDIAEMRRLLVGALGLGPGCRILPSRRPWSQGRAASNATASGNPTTMLQLRLQVGRTGHLPWLQNSIRHLGERTLVLHRINRACVERYAILFSKL